jgi:hypothetical protein
VQQKICILRTQHTKPKTHIIIFSVCNGLLRCVLRHVTGCFAMCCKQYCGLLLMLPIHPSIHMFDVLVPNKLARIVMLLACIKESVASDQSWDYFISRRDNTLNVSRPLLSLFSLSYLSLIRSYARLSY